MISKEELHSFFRGRKLGAFPSLIDKILKDMDEDHSNSISLYNNLITHLRT
jgi:hypothetical protein